MTKHSALLALLVLGPAIVAARRTQAETPPGRYTLHDQDTTATDDDTVTDNKTGLTWQRVHPALAPGCDEILLGCSRAQAEAYCEDLTLDGSNWRLPTISELRSLVVITSYSPAIDPIFANTAVDYFWASTRYVEDTTFSWSVSFYDGYSDWMPNFYPMRVRCVR